ncbi:MAG: hypothetical protein KDE33_22655, partial [Bacteroidetes bacterium]|nr:hypothetical protein [Bacteroidota bacterium]
NLGKPQEKAQKRALFRFLVSLRLETLVSNSWITSLRSVIQLGEATRKSTKAGAFSFFVFTAARNKFQPCSKKKAEPLFSFFLVGMTGLIENL